MRIAGLQLSVPRALGTANLMGWEGAMSKCINNSSFAVPFVVTAFLLSSGPAAAQTYDHMQCFKIKDEAKILTTSAVTSLLTEFTPSHCSVVGRGKLFCVPADHEVTEFEDKTNLGLVQILLPGEELQNARVCYRLRCSEPPGPNAPLLISDPFGIRLASRFKHNMLCAPAVIGVPPNSACGTFLLKWGQPGNGPGELSAPHGVAVDETTNSVYVADLGNDRVQRFSINGAYQTSWGTTGSLDGEFDGPHGVAVRQGEIYVTDVGNNRIQVFSGLGTFQRGWGGPGTLDGEFDGPQALAAGPGDVVYVADSNNHRIQRFASDGTFQMKWGVEGSGMGEFKTPLGIHVTASGNVLVSDSGNNRIQVFDADGGYLDSWGMQGNGELEFFGPEGISSDDAGNIYIADLENARVQVLDSDGNFVAQWGTVGNDNGEFHIGPHGVAAASDGTVYVVDTGNARIQKFSCY